MGIKRQWKKFKKGAEKVAKAVVTGAGDAIGKQGGGIEESGGTGASPLSSEPTSETNVELKEKKLDDLPPLAPVPEEKFSFDEEYIKQLGKYFYISPGIMGQSKANPLLK